jgi:hypothetical protein
VSQTWALYLPALFVAIALAISLITGKAFNPLRGMRPMIVNRVDQPGRYWAAIGLCVAFLALACWIA